MKKSNMANVVILLITAIGIKGFIDSVIILSKESTFSTIITIIVYLFFIYCFVASGFREDKEDGDE